MAKQTPTTNTHLTRRRLLAAAGAGGLGLAGGGFLTRTPARSQAVATARVTVTRKLASTDGKVLLPGRTKPMLVFGFKDVTSATTAAQATTMAKGKAEFVAPILAFKQGDGVRLDLFNVGFLSRPDLSDAHTIHWHGFRNVVSAFDGTPEMSIAVPPGRSYPYYFRPKDPGTYMYHCHFEDVEHVQMGMTGIVFVTPTKGAGFAYNDSDGSTAFARQFALLLSEVDTRPHDGLEAVQEFDWSEYRPNYFVINGRAWPDTLAPEKDPGFPSQPVSSLIQCRAGERVLLRVGSLGYLQHSMQLQGIRMRVVGEDATYLKRTGVDLTYQTSTLSLGPGEARDAIFVAPAFDASPSAVAGTHPVYGPYNAYRFANRVLDRLTNDGTVHAATGLGGMATEVRVFRSALGTGATSLLPAQTRPNQTF